MKTPDLLKPRAISMNMTPMIDVVFLLIIFFVVTHSLMENDASIPIELPQAETGQETEERETAKMILNIDEKENLFLGAEPITREGLKSALIKEKGLRSQPLEFRIRTDRRVPYRAVEPILSLCADAGIVNVSFSVIQE